MYQRFENRANLKINHKILLILLVLFINFNFIINFATSLRQTKESHHVPQSTNNLALHNRLLRFKRQSSQSNIVDSSSQPSNSNLNSNLNQSPRLQSSNLADAASSNNAQDTLNSNQDADRPSEEALSSLKCDFGTFDAPDMCKFKVLDIGNPLSKGVSSWTHGSGRLALYQGGPLLDASDRNDTIGGYIFYETSNPFASSNQQQSIASNQTVLHNTNAAAYESLPPGDPYSTITSAGGSHHNKQRNINNMNSNMMLMINKEQESFQRLTSGRISIGPSGSAMTGAAFITPNLTAPGPSGMCLSFKYAIQGLSAEELRIHVNDHKTERSRQIWSNSESAASNWTKGEILYSVANMHSVMFSASSGGTMSHLKDIQQRKFRGYLALDDIEISKHDFEGSSGCRGHCNFDGDLCGWTNGENNVEDNFDWSFGRGSDNLFTGPARDYTSSTNNELTGSFLYTDSSYPRRPGDKAILVSPMFQQTPTNDAMCMRLAVHMFGSGIGSLAIKIRYADTEAAGISQTGGSQGSYGIQNQVSNQPAIQTDGTVANFNSPSNGRSSNGEKQSNNDMTIWEMTGDAGNNWHQAQTSVSSSRSPFQVVIEGSIGENHLGNIAIDEISFSSGPCPTSPPVASKNVGDCTFEQSMCYWRNPDSEMHLDDLDWIKSADEQSIHGPNYDHTLKKRSGSYLKLENTLKEPKSGTRAFLLSPILQPKLSGNVQCLSFYYYMFMRSISPSGPNLGTIRVYLASNSELVPIWRLTNPISSPNWKHARASLSTALIDGVAQAPSKMFQIAFEGIWGDAPGGAIAIDDITVFDGACDIMPAEAKSVPGECTFDVDMCSWLNKTSEPSSLMEAINGGTDPAKSPFLQSVAQGTHSGGSQSIGNKLQHLKMKPIGWKLATVDSRPVNLQDHTYKAPIGYVYVDVLENNFVGMSQRISYILQSSESNLQQGQQIVQCLSFWFAAFGRQENNMLSVYLTQASAPPAAPDSSEANLSPVRAGMSPNNNGTSEDAISSENVNAWKTIDGRQLWSLSLRNLTESNRRKWQYAQTSLRADSNYIVKFVVQSNDGGFALDDISYYEGPCDTRPAFAKVQTEESENEQPTSSLSNTPNNQGSQTGTSQTNMASNTMASGQPKIGST